MPQCFETFLFSFYIIFLNYNKTTLSIELNNMKLYQHYITYFFIKRLFGCIYRYDLWYDSLLTKCDFFAKAQNPTCVHIIHQRRNILFKHTLVSDVCISSMRINQFCEFTTLKVNQKSEIYQDMCIGVNRFLALLLFNFLVVHYINFLLHVS